MLAILSDIHGNLEATEAVLADVASTDAQAICSLGDLVGYGPDSAACIRAAMEWDVVLAGSFDQAILSEQILDEHWTPSVAAMLRRLQKELQAEEEFVNFLSKCNERFVADTVLYTHTLPEVRPGNYIFPEDVYGSEKLEKCSQEFEWLCFLGCSHIAGVFEQQSDDSWKFIAPGECGHRYRMSPSKKKVICNAGSVGQPRDGDPRACYLLFDGETIEFRRVDYDIDKTVAKIKAGDDDDLHGERLLVGR